MSKLEICCNRPQFNKAVEVDEEVTVAVVERECLSRIRTVLGTGKVTVEAHMYNEDFLPNCKLWSVDVLMPNGVKFLSLWVRDYAGGEMIA